MRSLILATLALAGCCEIAAPVEQPVREVAGPGECIATLEWPDEYDAADSSATCWNGDRPHMVRYSRQRLSGKTCGASLYMPEGRVRRWFGCSKKPVGDPI